MGATDMQAKLPMHAAEPARDRLIAHATMRPRWWWPLLTLHSEYGGLELALPATPLPEDRPA
jgi:hypothetical protein